MIREHPEKWALKTIGRESKFTFPNGTKVTGTLIDRVAKYIPAQKTTSRTADYIDVIDYLLLGKEGKAKIRSIRLSYYRRKRGGQWKWAGQYALTEDVPKLKQLFRKAANEKAWFKDLIKGCI